MSSALLTQSGGCHCRRVRFAVDAPLVMDVLDCNCSMCRMSGFLHLIVPKGNFRLLHGDADLTTYSFNTGTAKHLFCAHCGVKSFYVPRSNPDGFDINVRCLDEHPQRVIRVSDYDGQNWERGAAALVHLGV